MLGQVPSIRYSREPITVWNYVQSSRLTGAVQVEGLYPSGSGVWVGFALIILQCSSMILRYSHWSIANQQPSWWIFIWRNSVVSLRSQHSHFFIKTALSFSTKAFEGPQNWALSIYIMARTISFPFLYRKRPVSVFQANPACSRLWSARPNDF